MQIHLRLLLATAAVFSPAIMAHPGSETTSDHLLEHLLIALSIGVPILYGLYRLFGRSGSAHR